MKPFSTFIFLISVFLLLLGVMIIFPKDGINLGNDVKIQFPTTAEFLTPDTAVNREVLLILADTIEEVEPDTSHLAKRRDSLRKEQLKIHIGTNGTHPLHNFFTALENQERVRVIHYGDSQIEGDRITGPVRGALQDKFGGTGPGLFPVVPVAPKLYVNFEYEGNWKRYAGFGAVDTNVNHKKYGALVNFSRYAPPGVDTLMTDTSIYRAAVNVLPLKRGYRGTRSFSKLKMHWGNTRYPVTLTVEADGQIFDPIILEPGIDYRMEEFDIPDNSSRIRLSFKGKDSPDIYALSLEGESGVLVDNVPFRGGSGTELSKTDRGHLSKMLKEISPDLFIMEFGGNVLPYIDGKKECESYGRWFQSQINMLKRIIPDASVLVIGPADMSVKEKTLYVTHPYLEDVRDALKKAAMNTGSAFWDMYGAMGGKNSMPVWVASDPQMAANDYIHFSPKGAVHIAKLFNNALLEEYSNWKEKDQNDDVAVE